MKFIKAIALAGLIASNFGHTDHIQAQGISKGSLHLSQNFRDYNVHLLSKKYFSFDSSLSQTVRIGYQHYLSRHWVLSAGLNHGFLINQFSENILVRKTFLSGVDADILFKFNNGTRLQENALIAPFLSFGYDLSYRHSYAKLNLNPWKVGNSYGLGTNINLCRGHDLQLHLQLSQQLGGEFTTHMNYRIGYVYHLPSVKSKIEEDKPVVKIMADLDKDGVPDSLDKCPEIAGKMEWAGCDPKVFVDSSFKLSYDSMLGIAFQLRHQIDSLQWEVGAVKKLLKQHIEASKKDVVVNPKPVVEVPSVQPPKKETQPTPPAVTKEDNRSYYVVVISTLQLPLAKEMAARLSKDYPVVKILPQPNGFFRVGIYATPVKSEALKLLEYTKLHGIDKAWLSLE